MVRTGYNTSTFRIFCNHILTILSNIINNQNLTDAHTCYKILKIEVFNKINLVETRFGFCPELTTKLSNLKETIFEVRVIKYTIEKEDLYDGYYL